MKSNAKELTNVSPGLLQIINVTSEETKRQTLEYINQLCEAFFKEFWGKYDLIKNDKNGYELLVSLWLETEPKAHELALELWRVSRYFKISQEITAGYVSPNGVSESRFSTIVNNTGKRPKSGTNTRQLFRAINAYQTCLNEKLKP